MVFTIKAKLRKWGNSAGIVIPHEALKQEGLQIDDEIEITKIKKNAGINELFGILPGNIPTEQLMKEIDEEFEPNEAT